MTPSEELHKAVSESAISMGSRYDISEMPELRMMSIRAAQSAADELGGIISSLKDRQDAVEEDIYAMVFEFIKDKHGVELNRQKHFGMQIDWADKTVDIISREVLDDILARKEKRK